jgi:mannose-6-phosphate isomerase-like protein (cupin superfamily)
MLVRKNFSEADEVRTVPHGRLEIAHLPGQTLARAVLEPGWKWSADMKPIAHTESCEIVHTAYVISGRMHVRMNDGSEIDLADGDAHYIGSGHDAWVVGDEPLIVLDIIGAEQIAEITAATEAPATA